MDYIVPGVAKSQTRLSDFHFTSLHLFNLHEEYLGASQVVVVVKYPPANAGDIRDMGSIPGFPRGGHGNLYFCPENPKDRGAWWAIVHRVTKSQT